MNNDEAMQILMAKRAAINSAINGMDEYTKQTVTKAVRMAAIKADAAEAGADISAWDGQPAPVAGDGE